METIRYTRDEFLSYLAKYQDEMMSTNKPVFMLIYMALKTKADTNIILRRVDFADFCKDLQIEQGDFLTFIEIDNKVLIQKSMI